MVKDSPITFSPINKMPNPRITSPALCTFWFLQNMDIITPMITNSGAISDRLNAINCPVIVVPILAPRIIPVACIRFISPEFTKLTTITVVALDDWMIAVKIIPTSSPINLFFVKTARILLILAPAAFSRLSLIWLIPYKNSPSPPNRENIVIIFICFSFYSFSKYSLTYCIS